MTEILPRWQEKAIKTARKERRVLLLGGPRQCGKTTLVKQLATKTVEYRTLDDETFKGAAESDPKSFVEHEQDMLIIDEIQHVPTLLPAIKKVVDTNKKPGQFLLTGSANIQAIPSTNESLAGRVANIRLRTLSEGEIKETNPQFLEKAFKQGFKQQSWNNYDREAILEIAFRGGFPEIIKSNTRSRRRWHRDYIRALLERDLKEIAKIHRHDAMRELVNTLAAWSSKYMDIAAIGGNLAIRRPTLESYINTLETLYLVERVHPWTKTDYARVGKQKKLFMTDTGLMTSILRWNIEQVRNDPDRSGKLVESFVFNELATLIDIGDGEYEIYHYRDRERREIDFIIERDDGAILGVEVKASATATKDDFKHLKWFGDKIAKGRLFIGIVLYSGESALSFGDNLWAVPFGAMWD